MFSPLSIGRLSVDPPVVQAALSGYSDWPMRVIARRLGAPYTICEVLLDQFVLTLRRDRKMQRHLRVSDEEHPCGVQLMGSEPERFAQAARKVVAAGFDAVDINFACPVRKVLGRCRGGSLLGRPATALEIVERVRGAVPPHIPVTVKMRRGLDESAASLDDFFTIFDGVWNRGVAAVTVHGRTVAQGYRGRSSRDFLREAKQRAGHRTVIGSGDVFSAQDCLDMLRETGLDGVAIARGAIGNPWIFGQVRALAAGEPLPPPPTLHQQREVIAEHYRMAEEIYGANWAGRIMRKFGIFYAQLHPDQAAVREAFIRVSRTHQWLDVLTRYYAEDRPGRYPDASGPGDLAEDAPSAAAIS